MRAGAIAHALDAQLCQFGNRRHTRSGQNIHGGHPMNGAQVVDHGLDVLGLAQARNKDAVCAVLKIGLAAL